VTLKTGPPVGAWAGLPVAVGVRSEKTAARCARIRNVGPVIAMKPSDATARHLLRESLVRVA
jgi:hypothetical protein